MADMSGVKFLQKYKITLKVKSKSNFMKALGFAQTLFSKITYQQFMNSYTSTIGSTIYSDKEWIDRVTQGTADIDDIALLVHETQHVLQFRNGSWKKYVTSGGRALLEAESIAQANRFRLAVSDADHIKTRHHIINQLTQYGCKLVDCIAAANYVEIAQQEPLTTNEMAFNAIGELNET